MCLLANYYCAHKVVHHSHPLRVIVFLVETVWWTVSLWFESWMGVEWDYSSHADCYNIEWTSEWVSRHCEVRVVSPRRFQIGSVSAWSVGSQMIVSVQFLSVCPQGHSPANLGRETCPCQRQTITVCSVTCQPFTYHPLIPSHVDHYHVYVSRGPLDSTIPVNTSLVNAKYCTCYPFV